MKSFNNKILLYLIFAVVVIFLFANKYVIPSVLLITVVLAIILRFRSLYSGKSNTSDAQKVANKAAKGLINGDAEYHKILSTKHDITVSIQETKRRIAVYYQEAKLESGDPRLNPQALIAKYIYLKQGVVGLRETGRSLLTGMSAGVISAVIIALPSMLNNSLFMQLVISLNLDSIYMAYLISAVAFIILVIAGMILLIRYTANEAMEFDTDVYKALICPYEANVIKSLLFERFQINIKDDYPAFMLAAAVDSDADTQEPNVQNNTLSGQQYLSAKQDKPCDARIQVENKGRSETI